MDCRYFFVKQWLVSLLVFMAFTGGCTSHEARQSPSERNLLKAALAEGETVILANSCSRVPSATFKGGGKAVFGSCYLTNLRFIYEESEWARTLAAIGKSVPANSDFGMVDVLKGAYRVFDANYVIEMGSQGKLNVVERVGQIIIPLSEIRALTLSGSRFSSNTPKNHEDIRWLTIGTRGGFVYIFEIYNRPPDKTGWMPEFQSAVWQKEIEKARLQSFK